jgi:hypothetical protein
MKWLVAGALVAGALVACSGRHPGKLDETKAKQLFDVVQLADAPPGVSDLTLDDKGTIWAIAERDRVVLELTTPIKKHSLDGVDAGLDTEAVTWLGDNHFALGIEATHAPVAAIAFADLEGDHVVVKKTRTLTSAELGVEITTNHGIEALCGRDDELLAATESVGKFGDGTRWAALVRVHGDELDVAKLHLTTDVGKISALTCKFSDDGTADVLAIERHYGVSRILHFVAKRGDADITPEVVLDLAPVLHDSLNLEGIVRLPDGRIVTVNDNQGSSVSGPTELLYFHPR